MTLIHTHHYVGKDWALLYQVEFSLATILPTMHHVPRQARKVRKYLIEDAVICDTIERK